MQLVKIRHPPCTAVFLWCNESGALMCVSRDFTYLGSRINRDKECYGIHMVLALDFYILSRKTLLEIL